MAQGDLAHARGTCIPKDRYSPELQKLIQKCLDQRGPLSDSANIELPSKAQRKKASLFPGQLKGLLKVPLRLRANKELTVKLGWYSTSELCGHLSTAEVTHTFTPGKLNEWQSVVLELPVGMKSIPPLPRPGPEVKGCLVLELKGDLYKDKIRTKPYGLDLLARVVRAKPLKKIQLITRSRRQRPLGKLSPAALQWLGKAKALQVARVSGKKQLQGHGQRELTVEIRQKHIWVMAPPLKKKQAKQGEARGVVWVHVTDTHDWIHLKPAMPVEVRIVSPPSRVPYIIIGVVVLLIVIGVVLRRRMYPPVARVMCLKNIKSGLLEEELFGSVTSRFKQPEHQVPLHKLGLEATGNMILTVQRDGAIMAELPTGVKLHTGGQEREGLFPVGSVDPAGRLRSPRGLGQQPDGDQPWVLLQNMTE